MLSSSQSVHSRKPMILSHVKRDLAPSTMKRQLEDLQAWDDSSSDDNDDNSAGSENAITKLGMPAVNRKILLPASQQDYNMVPKLQFSQPKKARTCLVSNPVENITFGRVFDSSPALLGLNQINKHHDDKNLADRIKSTKVKPFDHLKNLFSGNIETFPSASLPGFFIDVTEESVSNYTLKLAHAIREGNLNTLRAMLENGHAMQCGNSFGESVVHTACRRELYEVLNFLLDEANVTLKVCCDSGRTPLHDACWSHKPDWRLVKRLLDECPDFLYISDKRGLTPLDYVPPSAWKQWCEFLEKRGPDGLRRKEIC
jgi:Ankyrin repeats (3 copies)